MGRGFGRGGGGGFGGGMPDMGKLMKDMQKMQTNMLAAQEELLNDRIEATSGGGVVKAIVNGKGKLVSLEIKPEAVDPDDVEMLQDLIVTAITEAEERAEEQETEKMQGLTGGVQLPPGLF
jgi:DNA-binding YbaB/EbfC family protein